MVKDGKEAKDSIQETQEVRDSILETLETKDSTLEIQEAKASTLVLVGGADLIQEWLQEEMDTILDLMDNGDITQEMRM